jgi:hypothetical protein
MDHLLTYVDALTACSFVKGTKLPDMYHEIRFQKWCDTTNDSVSVGRRFILRGQDIPWTIEFEGATYQQGQCSGRSMSLVWFDQQ